MTKPLSCPDPHDLERLLLGQLPDPEAEALGQHLLGCTHCSRLLDCLHVEDPLIVCLQAGRGQVPFDNPVVNALVERLVRTPPDTSVTTPSALANETAGTNTIGSEPAPERVGRYQVSGRLGAGGMGVVYRAHDPELRRDVAIKVPNFHGSDNARAAARQRFLREARAAAALRHANVCHIHDVGEDEGRPYVVLDLVEGESLAERLRRQGRFEDCREAVQLVAKVADALSAVHARGMIHRDLKPGNILLEASGEPLLTDFGLARPHEKNQDGEPITAEGSLLGTPAYMAPEQTADEASSASDQYSLAVVLYQMLTGRLPFEGSTMALIHQIGTEQVPPPSRFRPDLDRNLERLLMKALARQAKDRYANVAEFAQALRGWMVSGKPADGWRPRPPNFLIGLGLSAAVMALVVAGVVLFWQTPTGTVRMEINDTDIQVAFDKNGPIFKGVNQKEIRVTPGEHGLHIKRGDLEFDTDKFILKKGDTVTLKVEWFKEGKLQVVQGDKVLGEKALSIPLPAAAKVLNDRTAAEWVQSLGGTVVVDDGPERTLRQIDLNDKQVTDAGLKQLVGLKGLFDLQLANTPVTDAGLKELAGLTSLEKLNLHSTNVTDAGIHQLTGLKELQYLVLVGTKVTGACLKDLSTLPKLNYLNLETCQKLGDAGLERVSEMRKLEYLNLGYTSVSDAGLAHLKELTELKNLCLWHTQVGDKGLAHLDKLTNLLNLALNKTQVSNAGLAHLKKLTKLVDLHLANTRVTDLQDLAGLKDLRVVDLANTQVTDAGLQGLAGLKGLQTLNLTGTKVTNAKVAELCKALPTLRVTGP